MFRKKCEFTLIMQDIPDNEWREPLKNVVECMESELKDSLCAITHSLPIVPLRAREAKADGRLFTPDIFDTVPLLKHLSNHSINPINRQPLFINDLGKNLIVAHELIKKMDAFLLKNAYTREDLLNELGISKDLYQFLLNSEYSTKNIKYSKSLSEGLDEADEEISRCVSGVALVAICFSVLISLLSLWVNREHIFNLQWVDALYKSAIEAANSMVDTLPILLKSLISKAPSALVNGILDFANFSLTTSVNVIKQIDYKLIEQSFQIAKSSSELFINTLDSLKTPALTITSTSLVSNEIFHHYANTKHWDNNTNNRKILIYAMTLILLFLGMDALTDCCGLTSAMTPNMMNKECVGLLPLVTVGVSSFFGRCNKRNQAQRDFDELRENNFEYKKML